MSDEILTKYKQIKEDIKNQIVMGNLKGNDKILSESQLCEKFNVSRITVTRAINDLVSEGYLTRIQGKGTFVKDTRVKEGILRLSGFTERMKYKNLDLKTEVLEKKIVAIPQKMADYFNLDNDTQVIYLKRLRIVDGKPLCMSNSYLMPEFFYWTLLEDMEKESLFDLLENKYNFKLEEAEQTIEINYLSNEDAKYLKLAESDPCLKFSLYCYLDHSRPAQFEETYYVGNRYVYQVNLKRNV